MNPQNLLWPLTRIPPVLLPGHVHVFAWDLDIPPGDRDWEILDSEETARARRFVFPQDRDRFVRAHSTMRRLLSQYSDTPSREISYAAGPYGKPMIADSEGERPLQFNLTHSGGIAALAVARDYSIGVDLERIRAIAPDIAEHQFSPAERETLKRLPPELWLEGFYRCWTSKEAMLKGIGLGLNLPLDTFDVEVDPRRAPACLGWRPPAGNAARWRLVELKPAPGLMGTLALHDESGTFNRARLQWYSLDTGSD
jgi:4'-phosphopantetheinyl transferase